jgi:cellulose synthase/poly-beta-1,6-N-acetylglucosamine synthase-like glycosyltransferase
MCFPEPSFFILFMTITPNISVIIPCNHGPHDLLKSIDAVCCQTVKPVEIILIDSSDGCGACPAELAALCEASGIELFYEYREQAFPGQARNIGLGLANAELIAFIDVQTIPRPNWLEASLTLFEKEDIVGVFGGCCFSTETSFERLVRDAFYGVLPRKTLPGSVFRQEVFVKVGQFIDEVRAGEDTEWMLRVALLNIPCCYPSSFLIDYVGLIGLDLNKLLRKWFRNYSASRDLPHLYPQKVFLWFILYPLVILIAYNWNYHLIGWHEHSSLYIHHVTKIATIVPPLGYLITRGILLPWRRGVSSSMLFPIRFIAIASLCFLADSVKALAFSTPNSKK